MELAGVRRVSVPRAIIRAGGDYALFVGEVNAVRVDLTQELYLRRAAWHPVTEDDPLGPLDARYSSHVVPLIRERL